MEINLNRLLRLTSGSLLLASALALGTVTKAQAQEPPLPRRPTVVPSPLHNSLFGSVVFNNESLWRLNLSSALEIIQILEKLPEKLPPFCIRTMDSLTEKLEDGCLRGTIRPREMRVSTITIEQATPLLPAMARTQISSRDPFTFTHSRLVMNPNTDTSDAYGSEVCHSILQAVPEDPQSEDETLRLQLQEGLCGSFGVTMSARRDRLSYPDYQAVIQDRALPSPIRGRYLGVITLPESLYNSLPTEPVLFLPRPEPINAI